MACLDHVEVPAKPHLVLDGPEEHCPTPWVRCITAAQAMDLGRYMEDLEGYVRDSQTACTIGEDSDGE